MIYTPIVALVPIDVVERIQPAVDAGADAIEAGPRSAEFRELCARNGWTLDMLAWGTVVTLFAALVES